MRYVIMILTTMLSFSAQAAETTHQEIVEVLTTVIFNYGYLMVILFVLMTLVIIGAFYFLIVAPNRVTMSALNERIENLEYKVDITLAGLESPQEIPTASGEDSDEPEEPTSG